MGIRIFQIVVPVLVLIFILWQLRRYYRAEVILKDIVPSVFISFLIGLVAIFPDFITNRLAKLLQFESNINAFIFFLIGLLFIAVILLYDMYRKQQKEITKLTIELGILNAKKEGTIP